MSDLNDMDLDDLVGAKKAADRPRFAPKNAKLKSQPKKLKTKVDTELHDQPPPQSQVIISANATKNEEFDIKPQFTAAAGNDVKMEENEKDVKMEEKEEDAMEEDVIEKKEDRVIREIDVYFKPEIDPHIKLYNFQYPLRAAWRPYDLDERCKEVRVHKTNKLAVEMDLSIDTTSKNYDASHDPIRKKTIQTLTSVMSSPETGAAHVVGVLIGNKLCITPIHATVQMRPSLEHPASGGSSTEVAVTNSVEGSKKSEDIKGENSDWISLQYHGPTSDHASSFRKKMAVQNDHVIQFSMSPLDYIDSLCPPKDNNDSKPKGPSRRDLLSLPLEERYKTWLIEGPHINRFDTLKHLAPNEADEDVLNVLQKYATLVQGLWVTKTALLADVFKGPKSLARDYVLLLFRKNNLISCDQIKAAGPSGKFMIEPLASLAIERPSLKDWKFKETKDVSFIKFHSKIVEVQDQIWEEAEKKIIQCVFKGRGEPGLKGSAKAVDRPGAVQIPNKNMSNNPSGAVSKDAMSNETREALPKALHKLFQAHKNCSFQQICQRLREMAVSESSRPKGMAKEAVAAARAVDHRSELVEMIEQVAIDIHGVYVPKKSYDHPQFDPFRNVVIGLLIVEGAKAKLRKGTIMETAKVQLDRDITPIEYQTVMNELCTSNGPIWILKNSDGSSK